MKKINGIIAVLVIIGGCQDNILDSTPYGQITSNQFWRNGDDVVAATNAVYSPLLDEDGFAHTEYTFDNSSDDMVRAGDHGDSEAQLELFTFNASNSHIANTWATKYEVISRANAVLINAPKVKMDDALRNRCMGEAYFLRGFAYWRLAVIWGDVPVLVEADAIANNFNKAKSSQAEVQAQAEADFLQAAALLPEKHDDTNLGRVTKGSAYGFLTKLYVYQGKWSNAIEAGRKITENLNYRLAPSFEQNFQLATENNPEILYSLQYEGGWTTDDSPAFYHTPGGLGGWGFHEPIQDLVDEFEPGDPRLGYSIFQPGDEVEMGPNTHTFAVEDTRLTGYAFKKYTNFTDAGDMSQSLNAPWLRSADVYLLVAEAKIRSGQNGDAELNAVRARAGLNPKSNATMTDIMHERRVELAGENDRHQDLMRWDKAGLIDITAHYAKDRGPYKPARTFVKPRHYFYPLPQREIDLSNGVLIQNPNY
ncbi:RagB/SusD family nutrient uptake outer membrane protein [Fulvivirgaceae bacterium PWU4]|uniref:RagB/SusD family nutrient uptake outer membrane protein n=1 Tax=Chryseosolibacter histidini TaxID=2782349 RepID=A0AAP2GK60_9BACT|nr:RagB/SusD family nutrient uptake outer membrane protein [Chryseosolibacter histidini]MBT1698709.1 RagB/SusD family nutrient uptake outer membrane protein [Chryseosolibacter histidini]